MEKKFADKMRKIESELATKEIARQALIEKFENWCGRTTLDTSVLETPEVREKLLSS